MPTISIKKHFYLKLVQDMIKPMSEIILCHYTECRYTECHYTECHYAKAPCNEYHYADVMLTVFILSVIMLSTITLTFITKSIVILKVIMPSVLMLGAGCPVTFLIATNPFLRKDRVLPFGLRYIGLKVMVPIYVQT